MNIREIVRNGLWDPERKRLTLFIHPGRVKTGVAVTLAWAKAVARTAARVVRVSLRAFMVISCEQT